MMTPAQLAATFTGLAGVSGSVPLTLDQKTAMYHAWALEQVSIQLGAVATAMNSVVAENTQANGLISQALEEVKDLIATIPGVTPPSS